MNPFIDWEDLKYEGYNWREIGRGGHELLKFIEGTKHIDEVLVKISDIKNLLSLKLNTSCYKPLRELLAKDFIESKRGDIYWVNPIKVRISRDELITKYQNTLKRDFPEIYLKLKQ